MSSQSKTLHLAMASRIVSQHIANSRSKVVIDALQAIDPERVSSIPSMLTSYLGKIGSIRQDRELSDEGKKTRIQSAASSQLGNIATLAKSIAALEAQHRADRDSAVPLPKAEVADALIDLALVQQIRQANPIPSKLVNMSERARLALARMPLELSGLTPDVQAKVHGSLMSPEKAAQLQEEAQALNSARAVVQSAIEELAPDAKWSPRELVDNFGTAWKLPGVVSPEVVLRMTGEAQEA